MKILKHGSPNLNKKTPRHFVCSHCGCEFIAEEHEYRLWDARYLGYSGNNQIVETQCPECEETVQGEKVVVIGDNGHSVIERWSNGEPVTETQK